MTSLNLGRAGDCMQSGMICLLTNSRLDIISVSFTHILNDILKSSFLCIS